VDVSPNVLIDPPLAVALARTTDATAAEADRIANLMANAAISAGLTVPTITLLVHIHETMPLVARTLRLRAELAESYQLQPGGPGLLHLSDALGQTQADLDAILSAPADADADRLIALLDAVGPIEPDDLFERKGLDDAVAHEAELATLLHDLDAHRDDPAYLADFFARLGPARTSQLLELVNALGYASDAGRLHTDVYADVVQPLARTLGAADTAGTLPPEIEAALLDFGAGDPLDPRFERLDPSEQDRAQSVLEERRRTLALLIGQGTFSADFTATAASEILRTGPVTAFWRHEGFLFGHPELALTDLVALRAVGRDDATMRAFVTIDADGDGWYENAGMLTQMGRFNDFAINQTAAFTGDPAIVRDELITTSARILDRGVAVVPLRDGTVYDPQQFGVVSTVVRAAGFGDVDDRLKRVTAVIVAPYGRELAAAYDPGAQYEIGGPSRLPDLSHDEVVAFTKELSYDQQSLSMLTANGIALMLTSMQPDIPRYIAGDQNAFDSESRVVGLYFGALGDGINEANIGKVAEREAMVGALRMVSDPLLGLAVGKIPGAGLPVISGVADNGTDALSDAVYGKLVPMPDLEDIEAWKTSLELSSGQTLADMVWHDSALRVSLGGPSDRDIADLQRADPVIADAVHDRFIASRPVADFIAATTSQLRLALVESKVFSWSVP
jgi:hypothetical protein